MINVYFAFIFGLMLGSFANVCIWRIPQELSIVKPRSFCPSCRNMIPWYCNIPVLSYICLRGKCGFCGNPISLRYPVIELITAAITASWFLKFEYLPAAFIFVFFGLILIILSGIDFEHFILPPQLTYPLIALGILSSFFNPFMKNEYMSRILYSLLGLAAGGGVILAIRLIGGVVFKKEAMGIGDIKLMMGIGAFTGPKSIFWIIFIGSIFGSIVGISMRLIGKKGKFEYIPFGPYLALGAIIYAHFSELINRFILLYY